jgi:hypothetical protein
LEVVPRFMGNLCRPAYDTQHSRNQRKQSVSLGGFCLAFGELSVAMVSMWISTVMIAAYFCGHNCIPMFH